MNENELLQKKVVGQAVKSINEHWLNKEYEKIGDYVSDTVVLFPPGSEKQILSREGYIQSYRDYDLSAATREFSTEAPDIEIYGDAAVAVCPFHVEYELNGKIYQERGRDILVFSRSDGHWKLVWRTLHIEPLK